MSDAFRLAQSKIGLNENGQKAALEEYLRNGGRNLDPAITAWCAEFLNATLAQVGLEGTGRANARSYLDWGEAVETPQQGDIAVFSNGDPSDWRGHVAFFDQYNPDGSIRVLGGNQSNSVNISSYSPDRLLGFRRATGQPQSAQEGSDRLNASETPVPEMQNRLAQTNVMPELQLPNNALDASTFMSKRRFSNSLRTF
ncbi:MAG: TIGR02594 family protein [Ahrensia sp.]|nr:TIGR02594 family protein [Ahrensia sp.]